MDAGHVNSLGRRPRRSSLGEQAFPSVGMELLEVHALQDLVDLGVEVAEVDVASVVRESVDEGDR